MNEIVNNATDDVEKKTKMNLFLQENDDVHGRDKVMDDVARFEMVESKMFDWLKEKNDDWHEVYVHEKVVLNKTPEFHQMNDPNNTDLKCVFREKKISVRKYSNSFFFDERESTQNVETYVMILCFNTLKM